MNARDLSSRIYAHRGFWNFESQQNSLHAFKTAFKHGFSVETDFRDHNGRVIISHDIVHDPTPLIDFVDYFDLGIKTAINLKTDGLSNFLYNHRYRLESTKSWVFDGSIPEMLVYKELGINHALRLSEYETDLPWISPVVWLDCFNEDWYVDRIDLIEKYSSSEIVLVSPEIHGREFGRCWNFYHKIISIGFQNVSICTDYPHKLMEVFNHEV